MVTSFLLAAVIAQAPALGKTMPDVTLTDMNGAAVRLSSFRGKKLILFNWASW